MIDERERRKAGHKTKNEYAASYTSYDRASLELRSQDAIAYPGAEGLLFGIPSL